MKFYVATLPFSPMTMAVLVMDGSPLPAPPKLPPSSLPLPTLQLLSFAVFQPTDAWGQSNKPPRPSSTQCYIAPHVPPLEVFAHHHVVLLHDTINTIPMWHYSIPICPPSWKVWPGTMAYLCYFTIPSTLFPCSTTVPNCLPTQKV